MRKLRYVGILFLMIPLLSFAQDIANVKTLPDGKFEFINSQEEPNSSVKYDFVTPSDNTCYHLVNNGGQKCDSLGITGGKWGYVDSLGREITPLKYDVLANFSEGRALVCLDSKYGYVDFSGKEITPITYDEARDYDLDVAMVKIGDKWGCIGADGNQITEMEFDQIGRFTNNMVLVSKDGRHGYINTKGKYVMPIDVDISVTKIVPESYWNY